MNQQLPVLISEGILAVFLVVAFILILSSTIYDIKLTWRGKSLRKMDSKFRRANKPAISLLIYAKNNADSIIKCLDSIRRNRYKKYDVVIINDSSTDDIRGVVKSYKQKHPRFSAKLYSKRKPGNKSEALAQGYLRSQRGELVMVIDATYTISNSLLKDSALRFWHDKKIETIRFNVNGLSSNSVTLLYYRFLQLSRTFLDKFYTLTSEYKTVTNLSGIIYNRSAFKKSCKSSEFISKLDSDLIVFDSSVNDDKSAAVYQVKNGEHSLYYLVFALITVALQTYSIYIAATFQSRLILTIGWLAVVFWAMIVLWSSKGTDAKDKIRLSLCAPFVYFLVYLQLLSHVSYRLLMASFSMSRQIGRSFLVNVRAV